MQTQFTQNDQGLIAHTKQVSIQLSPVNKTVLFDPQGLLEDTECNVLIRTGLEHIQCLINGQSTTELGFLHDGQTQWGRINTGDRPGHITFQIQQHNTTLLTAQLPIRPSKLNYETDYHIMRDDLQRIARTLVFSLPQNAHIQTQITNEQGSPLDFFTYITQTSTQLIQTLHAILKRPHRHLTQHTQTRPISLATGRDPEALTHVVRTPTHWTKTTQGESATIQNITHLSETRHIPTTNTPINRHLITNLCRLTKHLNAFTKQRPDLVHIQKQIERILRHRTFQNIPVAHRNESLPIHLDSRYQNAFAHLRHLNCALAPCQGGPFELSYRDTATLYEYWTWFTLIHTFQHLGFKPQVTKNLFQLTQRAITLSPTQGEASAIHLQQEHTHIRCLYNLTYTTASGRTLTHDLRPDIVIEVQTPTTRTVHAFDAKYRREDHANHWAPLREDIDKMHAYRDAVGQVVENTFQRTLQTAIVLFPAPFQHAYTSHTFYKSLSQGIGGHPLLPGDAQTQTHLRQYLIDTILP